MPSEIQLPRLGWSMEEGRFLGWLVRPGERVAAGQPLFTVEGDKATQDVEASASGRLVPAPDAPAEGETVAVGRVLGWLLADGEAAPTPANPGTPIAPAEPARDDTPAPVPPSLASPAAPVSPAHAFPASPRARRAARARGVDLASLSPSGTAGRIRERDVLAAAPAPRAHPQSRARTDWREEPLSPVRRTIAARLSHGRPCPVPVTLNLRCDASRLVALRMAFKARASTDPGEPAPTLNDILVHLVGIALGQHPALTASWAGDHLRFPRIIHVGFAVDTPDGLRVPVLRDVCNTPLKELAAQARAMAGAARSGRLAPADTEGACFTVTNLGALGIESFTPVVNPPESAILGVGAVVREAVPLDDGGFAALDRMTLSLTFDHRVLDGAPAARFLQSLRSLIEHPPVQPPPSPSHP